MTFVSICRAIARALGFHVHNWGKWELCGEVTYQGRHIGRTQIRHCSECGKMGVHRRYLV